MNEGVLMVIMAEAKRDAKDEATTEAIVRRCMRSAQETWITTDEEIQFRGAVAAAYSLLTDDNERARLRRSIHFFQALQSASQGVPVDFGQLLDNSDDFELVPLPAWWQEEKAASDGVPGG